MMDIAIGGSFLDIPQQDVVLHSENFRFAGVLADPYSTDIDIPLTTHNRSLLGIYIGASQLVVWDGETTSNLCPIQPGNASFSVVAPDPRSKGSSGLHLLG